jgi:eukaryotic-like serine/threonine-protein kinase
VEDPRIGSVLDGRYRVTELVASGGMGVVYRGERLKLGRGVAIKFLHSWMAAEERAIKRFEIEARAMAKLRHPHCAAVIDFGVADGAPYVVMDFIDGETLGDVLDRGRLTVARALTVARQILSGLAHAHKQGIIHRDVKPDNIMVSEMTGVGDQVQLLDFGLARLRETASALTDGMAVGTPSYMAPEQTLAEPVDARTDVYACGVLLFQMLTGDKPFVSDSAAQVMQMHREEAPPRLADIAPDVRFSAELEAVVARALAKAPADRFPSAAEMSAALEAVPEVTAPPPRAAPAIPHAAAEPVALTTPPQPSGRAALPPLPAVKPAPVQPAQPAPMPPAQPAPMPPAHPAPMPPAQLAPPAQVPLPTSWAPPGLSGILDPRHRRRILAVAGAVALVAIGVIAALTGGSSAPDGEQAPAAAASAPAVAPAPGEPAGVARAREMIAAGRLDEAERALVQLRRAHRDRAEIHYLLGALYFERMYWSDGMTSYRAAMRLEPAYREDPALIQSVLRGLVSPNAHEAIAAFLRDEVGAAAVPHLREVADSDPHPRVRERAARALERY